MMLANARGGAKIEAPERELALSLFAENSGVLVLQPSGQGDRELSIGLAGHL